MRMWRRGLLYGSGLAALLIFSNISIAQNKTASGVVTSYSLSLGPISGYNSQGYGFTVYYSTYDGIANNDPLGWSNNWLSYEAMPTTPGLGTYRTDFAIRDSYGYYFNRGTMTFTIPATDSDGNGCPDALQVNKSYSNVGSASSSEYVYNLYGTGNWDSYGTLSPTFTFSRNAGSSVGSVSGSEYDPNTGATSTFSGNFNVEGGTGTATYNPTTKAITFAGNSFSFDASGSGTSTFTRISDNQVSVAQFNFIASDGSRTVKAFTLNRTGNYYRAYPVELFDGDPSTSFVDFRYCHVEILDTNDTDGDGIPDLSDINLNQTITFGALTSKTYGVSPFNLTGTASSGLPLSYASSNTSVATVSGSVVTIVGAGTTTITATQIGNSSYNPAASVSQTLAVNKADQTITFTTLPAKTYGDPAFALTGTSSSGLPLFYYTSSGLVATVSGSTVTIAGAGTVTIHALQSGNSNFNPALSVSQDLFVSKASLSSSLIAVIAPSSLVYSRTVKSYTASASGVSGFSCTYTGVSPMVYGPTTTAPINAGTYSVTVSSTDPNYVGSKVVNFTITPLSVTVSAAAKTKIYGSSDPALSYASSGLLGTDSFTGSLTRAVGESVGSYAITIGTLSAGSNYALSYTGASFGITAATLSSSVINFSGPSGLVYDGSSKGHTASAVGVSGFSYTYTGVSPTVYASTTTAPKNVGAYSVTASSTDANYAGSKTVNFTITPQPVTVTAAAKTKAYGSSDPTLTYASSGLLGTDAFTGTLTRTAGEEVGSYNIAIGTLSAGSNYSVSYVGSSMVITANYLSWASSYGLSGSNALQSADPDNDGSNNAHEFAFCGSPVTPGSRSVSGSVSTGGIKYVWFQRKDISQVSYTAKTGNDLNTAFSTWSAVSAVASNPQPTGIDSNYEQVEVVLPTTLGKGFLKVQADVK